MKEVTIKTIGWTLFGITFCVMFYGMFITMAISNANIETTININMDNETKEAIIKLSEVDYGSSSCIVKEYEWMLVEDEFSNGWAVGKQRVLVNEFVANNCSIIGG